MNYKNIVEGNIYVSSTFFSDNSRISDVLQICVKHGIRHIELGSNHVYESDLARIVRQFDCHYLVHNYFPIPSEPFVINPASLDEGIYKRSVEHIFRAIDFCKEINAKLYSFHPGFLTDPIGANQSASNYDFQFIEKNLQSKNYEIAFDRMLEAIKQAVYYAKKREINIAIETEGSFSKPDHLLMQRPEEYKVLFQLFPPGDLGINLNLGHLHLASNVFGYEKNDFVDLISDYIIAMELSHNEGAEDEHKPLVEDGWYWEIITDPRFAHAYKILEFRNTTIETVKDNLKLCSHRLY